MSRLLVSLTSVAGTSLTPLFPFMMNERRAGYLVEYGETTGVFTNPRDRRTEDYITGRFG